MFRTKGFVASTLIALAVACANNAIAEELPNVELFVADDSVSMSALARTEQKLGYMGDIDEVRWTLYKCLSLDVGAGIIRGGLDCELKPSTGGSTELSDEYKKLQEEFSGTECKQNANWEAFTSQLGSAQKAGTVSCSSLAHAYCSAADADKASSNLTTYYTCTKNGKPISCIDLAETYCEITNIHPGGGSSDDSGSGGSDSGSGSSSGMTDEEKAAIQQKENEDKAKDAVSKSNKRKCIVDGEEVDCDDLAEANEIRKQTNKESTFDSDSTECYADITCKDSEGLTVACKKARDVIQCGKSSEEGLSIEYSCFVGGETVDCGFLGEGECTEDVCNEMCPEYGGGVVNNTCTCYNVPAVCIGMCEYGAIVSENSRSIATVDVTNAGSGYSDRGVLSKEGLGLSYTLTAQSSEPKVKVTIYDAEGSGTGAIGEAVYSVDSTSISTTITVTGITVKTPGSGYTSPKATVSVNVGSNSKAWGVALDTITYPVVTVTDSTGSGAELKAILNGGKITAIQVINGGTYYVDPVITITSNAGSGAEAKVSKITDCVCNDMPDCSVECEFSGVPVGNGTNKCDCYTEPDCNDTSHCKYGGYPEVKSDDSAYVCTEATCPYGYLTDEDPDKCDASICPYGSS